LGSMTDLWILAVLLGLTVLCFAYIEGLRRLP
jgi:hypothetical protein